jgi:hypothetical protein
MLERGACGNERVMTDLEERQEPDDNDPDEEYANAGDDTLPDDDERQPARNETLTEHDLVAR